MYKVIVPATSANLGPGFDCLGMALEKYNITEVEEIASGLKIEIASSVNKKIYDDENNMIYKTIMHLFDKVGYKPKGIRIVQNDSIPSTRGLGSSSACIVAGLFLGNAISGQKLSVDELAYIAASMEGHPDNVTPAIYGGVRAGIITEGKLHHTEINIPQNLKAAAFIPDFTLSTTKARMVLPSQVPFGDAVFNLGRLAMLTSSLASGNIDNISCAFEDRLHQPYRKKYIPDIDKIFSESLKNGAKGCFISGAGPTLIALLGGEYDEFVKKMSAYTLNLKTKWNIELLNINKKGVEVFLN